MSLIKKRKKITWKEILLFIASPIIFLLVLESILLLSGFKFYPLNIGFEITPKFEIFEVREDLFWTKKNKESVFNSQCFFVEKGKEEKRIIILGGSSAFNLWGLNHLNESIKKNFPGEYVTIINMGGESYGSNRVLMNFNEMVKYEPDLVIVYSGHNEFEERFMQETFFKDNFINRLNDRLMINSRSYQFLSWVVDGIRKPLMSKNIEAIKEGRHILFPEKLELNFPITVDKDIIYENYRGNLIEMVKISKINGFDLILSTVAYNRLSHLELTSEEITECTSKADTLDCLNNKIDTMTSPHSGTLTTNEIVREVAEKYGAIFMDVDNRIILHSSDGIPGDGLFDDSCHLNDKGNIILQDVLFETIKEKTDLFS